MPALYPAFFFVLEKTVKSAGNAVIPRFPTHRSYELQGSLKRRRKHPTLLLSIGIIRQKIVLAQSSTNGPRSLSRVKAGTHSAFGERSHTTAHTAKQGASLLCNRAGHLTVPHQAKEQPEEADARLRRVSASSGTAAPLGCVICLQLGDVAVFSLCAQYFLNVRGEGWYHSTLSALYVLLKRRTAACQKG